jgi:hypothetical protein
MKKLKSLFHKSSARQPVIYSKPIKGRKSAEVEVEVEDERKSLNTRSLAGSIIEGTRCWFYADLMT